MMVAAHLGCRTVEAKTVIEHVTSRQIRNKEPDT